MAYHDRIVNRDGYNILELEISILYIAKMKNIPIEIVEEILEYYNVAGMIQEKIEEIYMRDFNKDVTP